MRHNKFFSIALIGTLALLATACVKDVNTEDPLSLEGTRIVFSAATSFDNGVETRAEYSGLYGSSPKTERIDWKANDPIKINYNSNSGNYTVSANGSPSSEKSYATVSGGDLVWAAGSTHVFYALYPNNSNGSLVGNVVSGTIPAAQSVNPSKTITVNGQTKYQPDTEHYGFMFGYKSTAPAETVELPFKPAFTTFEFKLKRKEGDADKKIKEIQITTADETGGTNLTGKFTFTIPNNGGDPTLPAQSAITIASSSPAPGKTITLDFSTFSGGGVSIPADSYLDFSVLALPINQKYVKVMFTYTDNSVKKLSLKDNSGNWYEFIGGKKYIITNDNVPGGDVWKYYVEDIPDINLYGHVQSLNNGFTVKSYRMNAGGTKEPVKWIVQYSTDGNSWSNTQPSSWQTNGAKFSISTTSGDGGDGTTAHPWEANYANILRPHREDVSPSEKETSGMDSEQAAIAVLRGRGTLPSETYPTSDGYYDLSKHPIYPVSAIDGPETTQETANCYVITRPGYYKFPLVYGNAINENAPTATSGKNIIAYDPQYNLSDPNNINYYLRHLVRHDDKPITDPWIHKNGFTVAEAVVVWQDVTDASMQILLDSDISISDNYVKFQIKEANIRPGNIVVAARTSNGTILWSWHLWVTEKDLSPQTIKEKPQSATDPGREHNVMKYNLGWTDKVSAHGEHWQDWKFYVRIIQTDDSGNILNSTNPQNIDNTGAADVFMVAQYGESISVDANVGSNCFYQWGRKDPILPAASNNTNKRVYSAKYAMSDLIESSVKVKTVRDDSGTIGQSIRIPYNIFWSRRGETFRITSNGTTYYDAFIENHMFIGIATNSDGGSLGKTAWYGNLWDAGLIPIAGSSGNALSVNNRLPIKTVYDPSPRGYCVPYTFTFTSFSEAPWNDNHAYYPVPRDGVTSDGWNFVDGLGGGGKFYLPFAGARGGDGTDPLYDVTTTMYYWTSGKLPYDDKWGTQSKSKNFTFFRNGHTTTHAEVWAIYDQFSEGAYAIRPVLQVAF